MTKDLKDEVERHLAVMRDGASEVYGEEDLRDRLHDFVRGGRPLRVKLGMDPSAPDLHLGHTVVLQKLRKLQELGHTPIFLVGDFTARIGDPTGKKKTRPALSVDQVRVNAETYVDQVSRVLDVSRAEVRFNSEWTEPMTAAEIVQLCSKFTVARLLEREDFATRYKDGTAIAVHEFLYPFIQSYDSVVLEADIELGGTDQTFNLLMGREIQRAYGQPPQAVITHPLLVGTDGHDKMSKSLGNIIGITDPPEDSYGKVMSISDELMLAWFDALRDDSAVWTQLADHRRRLASGEGDPLGFKKALAWALVERFHGAESADIGAAHFAQVIGRKEVPDTVPETSVGVGEVGDIGLLDLLRQVGLTTSNSEGRRLVEQGAVKIDAASATDPTARLGPGSVLIKVGKRRYHRANIG